MKLKSLVSLVNNFRFKKASIKEFVEKEVPTLQEFIKQQRLNQEFPKIDSSDKISFKGKFFIETYGCQMNESDSEIVNSILNKSGYLHTKQITEADIVLLNTCSIRENAENKIWHRLNEIKSLKQKEKKNLITGVLGCMAERLKEKLLDKNKTVDIIVGPDAYRDLPQLIEVIRPLDNNYAMNVQLSVDETYGDIAPIRMDKSNHKAYVSIMRGCNNMCSFCIVPFTRGRERSRPYQSIIDEIKILRDEGVKEVTLLGQNVNSYHDSTNQTIEIAHQNSEGFKETYKLRNGAGYRFAQLLESVAVEAPEMRIRFTSPHPKDFPDEVLQVISEFPNLSKQIHIPAQSGNSQMLERMRRNYTREAYINLVENIRSKLYGVSLSSDFIFGFCGETEEQHLDTISLLEYVKYDLAFLFAYSMREKTQAHRKMVDDVPEVIKKKRLAEGIDTYLKNLEQVTKNELGRVHLMLVDGPSLKMGEQQLSGKTDTFKSVILNQLKCEPSMKPEIKNLLKNMQQIKNNDNDYMPEFENYKQSLTSPLINQNSFNSLEEIKKGEYVAVYINEVSKKTLFGVPLGKTTIKEFSELSQNKPFIA